MSDHPFQDDFQPPPEQSSPQNQAPPQDEPKTFIKNPGIAFYKPKKTLDPAKPGHAAQIDLCLRAPDPSRNSKGFKCCFITTAAQTANQGEKNVFGWKNDSIKLKADLVDLGKIMSVFDNFVSIADIFHQVSGKDARNTALKVYFAKYAEDDWTKNIIAAGKMNPNALYLRMSQQFGKSNATVHLMVLQPDEASQLKCFVSYAMMRIFGATW